MTDHNLPTPSQLGLPAKFDHWRRNQPEAVHRATTTDKRYVGLVAPTGFGKSIVASTIATLRGGRQCYTVVNKALQDQIIDKDKLPYFDIRGKGNYDCELLMGNGLWGAAAKCDKAEHLCDACVYKEKGCHYFDSWRRAKREPAIITNYSYWLAINKHNEEGIGAFDTLILDEAHNADAQLSASLRIELQADQIEKFTRCGMPAPQAIDKWREWAGLHLTSLRPQLDAYQSAAKVSGKHHPEERELRYLVGALESMRAMMGDWIEDRSVGGSGKQVQVAFEPIWPGPYASALVRNTPYTLLMSATIRPKTLQLLGLPAEETEFLEYPSSFPLARRPVIHVKTVAVRKSMSEDQRREWVRRIDQIIDKRTHYKGIIHTVSFEQAEYIYAHSRHRARIMVHERGKGAAWLVERFAGTAIASGTVLLSPSVGEGYDFADDLARYQIIAKVPFLYSGSPIVKARMAADEDYGNYVAMQKLIQMCGRIVRSETDWGETLIVDDQFGNWFWWECLKKGFVPGWFAPAVKVNQMMPKPLEFAVAA